MNPPKFKKGDMVQLVLPEDCLPDPDNGAIGTVIYPYINFAGEQRYVLDTYSRVTGRQFSPLESALRLIKGGGLKLDETSDKLTQDNLEKVIRWLEKSL